MEQQPKLVGQEAVTTQAVGLEVQLQLFDPVFHVAPEHIDLVIDELGVANQISDHEALVGAQAGVLHLGDDPAGPGPGLRLITESCKKALLLPCGLIGSLGFFQEWRGLLHHAIVGDEADDIADLLPLQIAIERRHGKAGIGPEKDQGVGIGSFQLLDQPLEHGQGPMGSVGVARAQHRGQGKAGAAVEDEERVIHMLFVITVEEAELLLTVGRIVGGVHVQDDDLPGTWMGLEVQIQEPVGEAAQVFGGNLVLKAAESGLREHLKGQNLLNIRSYQKHGFPKYRVEQ